MAVFFRPSSSAPGTPPRWLLAEKGLPPPSFGAMPGQARVRRRGSETRERGLLPGASLGRVGVQSSPGWSVFPPSQRVTRAAAGPFVGVVLGVGWDFRPDAHALSQMRFPVLSAQSCAEDTNCLSLGLLRRAHFTGWKVMT